MTVLTPEEARRIAVAAQGLHGCEVAGGCEVPGDAASVLRRLGCVQIDSMSAVRRSHELVLLSRGAPAELDSGLCFEGMAHALSLIAMELWPAFGFRRRHVLANGWRGPAVDMEAVAVARGRLEREGRIRLRDFGGASGQGWERDSPYRWALEWLAASGGAVCGERDRWERVYSLPELVIPDAIRAVRLDDEECVRELCRRAVAALGVATTGDVADYFRLRPAVVAGALESLGFARTQVVGWREIAWLSPDADPGRKVDEERVTALSPFDSLVWTRERQLRLFGRDYRLEAYKPAAKRTFGYFAMPVLAGSEIVGRVALRRRSGTLVVENAESMAWSMLDLAVDAVAEWTGCAAVKYEIPGDDTVPSERGQPRTR